MLKQEEKTRETFNDLKKYYDETWDPKDHTLHVGFFGWRAKDLSQAWTDATEVLIQRLNKLSLLKKESRILDVGCGAGRTLMTICEKYQCAGVGVDLSDAQIQDAKMNLLRINKARNKKGLPKLNISFIQGSGSGLKALFPQKEQFSHILSQDALLLVVNKRSLYKNLFRLLQPGGALAIVDFLSSTSRLNYTKKDQKVIYRLINWKEGLSFDLYEKILRSVGFKIIHSEERYRDMIKTYSLLIKQIHGHAYSKNGIYSHLVERYQGIVRAAWQKKMSWGWFFAIKQKI